MKEEDLTEKLNKKEELLEEFNQKLDNLTNEYTGKICELSMTSSLILAAKIELCQEICSYYQVLSLLTYFITEDLEQIFYDHNPNNPIKLKLRQESKENA